MRYVVGVDGGGTKTTAAVIGDNLGELGQATTGPANSRSVGVQAASANIANAITEALRLAGVALGEVAGLCICMAGFDTDLDLPTPQGAIRLLGYEGVAIFENDVVGAWAGATEARQGIVVIAGTGATALGMNARGELWRTDGWDYVLGDSGSGYDTGLLGIRAAIRALDGRAGRTLLVRELRAAYGAETAEAMRRLVDSTDFGKFEISAFGVHVDRAAREGDATAIQILETAGVALSENAIAIVQHLGMEQETFPISTVGSMFKSQPWVTDPFHSRISRVAPHAFFRAPLHPPEVGAAILGQRRLEDGDHGSWTLGEGRRRIRRGLTVAEALGE